MAIEWGLAPQGAGTSALSKGLELGVSIRDRREKRELQQQLLEQKQAETQAKQQEAAQKQLPVMSQLLRTAKARPDLIPQLLGEAQRMGIDVSRLSPETLTPDWIDSQIIIADGLQKPEGREAATTISKHLAQIGVTPETHPNYPQIYAKIFEHELAKPYTDPDNRTILDFPDIQGITGVTPQKGALSQTLPPQDMPKPQPLIPQGGVMPFQAYLGAAGVFKEDSAAGFLKDNGFVVSVGSREEYEQLPPGAKYTTGDGQVYEKGD